MLRGRRRRDSVRIWIASRLMPTSARPYMTRSFAMVVERAWSKYVNCSHENGMRHLGWTCPNQNFRKTQRYSQPVPISRLYCT